MKQYIVTRNHYNGKNIHEFDNIEEALKMHEKLNKKCKYGARVYEKVGETEREWIYKEFGSEAITKYGFLKH